MNEPKNKEELRETAKEYDQDYPDNILVRNGRNKWELKEPINYLMRDGDIIEINYVSYRKDGSIAFYHGRNLVIEFKEEELHEE